MALARTLAQLSDVELEQRFLEAERHALEWSGQGIGRHAEHQAGRWMQEAAACRAELDRRAAGGATPRSTIEVFVDRLRAAPGVTIRAPCSARMLDRLCQRYRLPDDYVELMRLTDGANGCYHRGELRSASAILGDRRHARDGFRYVLIARRGDDRVSIDTTNPNGPEIVEVCDGRARTYPRFVDFFTAMVGLLNER